MRNDNALAICSCSNLDAHRSTPGSNAERPVFAGKRPDAFGGLAAAAQLPAGATSEMGVKPKSKLK
jgi:hypothetical protein